MVDEYGNDLEGVTPPQLPAQSWPWTDAEINDVRQFSTAWRKEHGVTQGDPGQLEIAYENLRMQGLSHDDARQGAINVLGWQGDTAPPAPPPPPTTTTSPGPSTSTAPTSTVGTFDIPPPSTSTPMRDTGDGYAVPAYVPPTPVFTPPPYTPPPAFAYDDFQPTTAADLYDDPSYTFRVNAGLQSLTNSAAARGVANTGGTLKDFINYGQDAASQEFSAVDNRRRQTYTTNRAGAVDTYNTNYQTQYSDPYKIAYTGAVDAFTPQMTAYQTEAQAGQHEADQDRSYDYNTWLQQYNMWRANRNDTFDEQYRITALQ
jgi:hypothetical protein